MCKFSWTGVEINAEIGWTSFSNDESMRNGGICSARTTDCLLLFMCGRGKQWSDECV